MKKFLIYLFISCILASNMYFIYENNNLKEQIIYLKQENEKLKETPEIYWQTAIEKFNNKSYIETKEILNKLIEKFPTSNLIKKSQEKIKEINLIEKKKKEEEQRIIKSLPKKIANAKSATDAENKLNFLDTMYDDTYYDLKKVIKEEREKLKEKIEREREIQEYLTKAETIMSTFNNGMKSRKDFANFLFNLLGEPTQIVTFNNVPTFGNAYFFDQYFLIYGNKFNLTNMTLHILYKRLVSVPFCIVFNDFDNTTNMFGETFNNDISIFYYGKQYDYKNKNFKNYRLGDYM